MNSLKLDNPKMMDVAVPANMRVGLAQDAIAKRGWAVSGEELAKLIGHGPTLPWSTSARCARCEQARRGRERACACRIRAVAEAVKPGGGAVRHRRRRSSSCSCAPMASVRRWRSRRPRRLASRPRATSMAACRIGANRRFSLPGHCNLYHIGREYGITPR